MFRHTLEIALCETEKVYCTCTLSICKRKCSMKEYDAVATRACTLLSCSKRKLYLPLCSNCKVNTLVSFNLLQPGCPRVSWASRHTVSEEPKTTPTVRLVYSEPDSEDRRECMSGVCKMLATFELAVGKNDPIYEFLRCGTPRRIREIKRRRGRTRKYFLFSIAAVEG